MMIINKHDGPATQEEAIAYICVGVVLNFRTLVMSKQSKDGIIPLEQCQAWPYKVINLNIREILLITI